MADFVLEALFNIKRNNSSNKNKRRLKKEERKKEQNSIFVTFICTFLCQGLFSKPFAHVDYP